MINRIKLFLVLMVLISISALAQETGTLRGVVKDSTSGEVLAYCNIYIKDLQIGASTDKRGYFIIRRIPANKLFTITVSYVGYKKKELRVFIIKDQITHIDLQLSPESYELQTVEKIGKRVAEENATDIGLQRISIKEIEALPRGGEVDVFRSLQYISGVRSTGDASARYFVRGGASNQNLVLLDGITIYNPFHALGIFSVIDPEIINNVEFYKGGFTTEYSGRLSSVMSIITKDGNQNTFGVKTNLSLLSAKAMIEGPLPGGSYFVSGRKSYSNFLTNKFLNNENVPIDFYDMAFRLNYRNDDVMKNAKLSAHGFFSGDNIMNNDPTKEDYKWSSEAVGFKYFQIGDGPLFYEFGISQSNFLGEVLPKESSVSYKKNIIKDLTISFDFSYVYDSKDELGIGLHIKDISSILDIETNRSTLTSHNYNGSNISLYAKYKYLRFENFGADIGARVNVTRLALGNIPFFFEPRISMTYRLSPLVAFKAAWGGYYQELTTVSDENEIFAVFEPWIITPHTLKPAMAFHYILGTEIDFTENLHFEMETYYKKVNDITALNEKKFFPRDPDLLQAQGEAYGADFILRMTGENSQLTLNYSLGYTFKEVNGVRYFPRYDSRHTGNISWEFSLGDGWKTNIVWLVSSGVPFTKIAGYYDKLNTTNYNPENIFSQYYQMMIYGEKNIERLPMYHRLDFSIGKKLNIFGLNCAFDLSIINAYDRKNIFYFKRNGERVNMLPFLPSVNLKVEF